MTSLQAVKNLLVIGDSVKGVWFVAFQVCFSGPSRDLFDTVSSHVRRRTHTNSLSWPKITILAVLLVQIFSSPIIASASSPAMRTA